MYSPIFVKQTGEHKDTEFLLAYQDYVYRDWVSAYNSGITLEEKLGVLYGFSFKGGVMDLDEAKAVKAKLEDVKVLLLSGPLFQEVVERVENG